MTNVFNPTFKSYVNFIATHLTAGAHYVYPTTIKVNLDGLTDDAGQLAAAKNALSLWSQTTGLNFVASSADTANIVFSNDSSGQAYTTWSNGHAVIDVAKNWMQGWPTSMQWSIGSYGLQTFIHEIGHALGLDHGGIYNGSANYATDRMFDIDTWQYSAMSYFDQTQYTANKASYLFLSSPMIADVAAIQKLYGNLPVNTGNTTYGANSTVMLGVTDFGKHPDAAFTIHDTGGYDTFDLTNAAHGSMIDLHPGYFSNINGHVGNVAIATDTVIESAIGSNYSDTIYGNAAGNALFGGGGDDTIFGLEGNDFLSGGAGNDRLYGGTGRDTFVFSDKLGAGNVDTIGDFNVVDDVIDLGIGVFSAFRTVGELVASAFTTNATGLATHATDRIIYDSAHGALYYDPDGTGAAAGIKFANLSKQLAMTYHDFLII